MRKKLKTFIAKIDIKYLETISEIIPFCGNKMGNEMIDSFRSLFYFYKNVAFRFRNTRNNRESPDD